MQKFSRYISPVALLLAFLVLTAGCAKPNTPQGDSKSTGSQVQQEEQYGPGQDSTNSAGETPGQNKNSVPPETKDRDNKTAAPAEDPAPDLLPATVTYVVDGDTVHVTLAGGKEEKVRFIGVNTPESTKEIEPYGKEASAYTKTRLDGRKVWLEPDVEERDRYGRLLAYIWLEQPANDSEAEVRAKMFNAELLLEGYAQVMTVPPNVKYADLFIKLQREAREAGKGLWGPAGEEKTGETEDYYVASARSKKFHRPDCEWGKKIAPANMVKFKTVDEALDAGYEPCRVCRP
jgi:micrococcal nuclease